MASLVLAKLIAERHRVGVTQVELARRLGVTQAVVARLESGRQDHKISTLERYAQAIGATIQVMAASDVVGDSGSGSTGLSGSALVTEVPIHPDDARFRPGRRDGRRPAGRKARQHRPRGETR